MANEVNAIQQARQLGQAVWLDYISRAATTSGELADYIARGISGVTSNPNIFEKAIVGSDDYDKAIASLAAAGVANGAIYEALAVADIQAAADELRPLYESSSGEHGYVSLEVNPWLAYDTDKTVAEATRLWTLLERPNAMIKVPATSEGIPAIRRLTAEGINVNATLIFSLDMYRQVMEAYLEGIEARLKRGKEAKSVASVASFFLSRIDTMVDNRLRELIEDGSVPSLAEMQGKAALASARLAYHAFRETFTTPHFETLRKNGVRRQRLLWASTGTKNPAYSDVMYVIPLIGPDTVNTMPTATIQAFLKQNEVKTALEEDAGPSREVIAQLAEVGIDLKEITDQLLTQGVMAFAEAFDKLILGIEEKKCRLLANKEGSGD